MSFLWKTVNTFTVIEITTDKIMNHFLIFACRIENCDNVLNIPWKFGHKRTWPYIPMWLMNKKSNAYRGILWRSFRIIVNKGWAQLKTYDGKSRFTYLFIRTSRRTIIMFCQQMPITISLGDNNSLKVLKEVVFMAQLPEHEAYRELCLSIHLALWLEDCKHSPYDIQTVLLCVGLWSCCIHAILFPESFSLFHQLKFPHSWTPFWGLLAVNHHSRVTDDVFNISSIQYCFSRKQRDVQIFFTMEDLWIHVWINSASDYIRFYSFIQ